jgi:thioredoxin-like negative regulator of GroEL
MTPAPPPDALLLIAPGCPHCPAVLDALAKLLKEGALGRLEVVNIAARPEMAEGLAVRSVPWTRIGGFELAGAQSLGELRQWATFATQGGGGAAYLTHLLEQRQLARVVARVEASPHALSDLLALLGEEQTPMAVRIGVGAVLEELAGSERLRSAVPELIELTLSERPQTRADACHSLALAEDPKAIPAVERLLQDEDAEVREIAAETLAVLNSQGRHSSLYTSPSVGLVAS